MLDTENSGPGHYPEPKDTPDWDQLPTVGPARPVGYCAQCRRRIVTDGSAVSAPARRLYPGRLRAVGLVGIDSGSGLDQRNSLWNQWSVLTRVPALITALTRVPAS